MGARQEDLGTALLLPNVVDVRAHAVADLEVLARQQLVAAQHRLGPAEIDDHIAVVDPLDQAVDDLADPILELLELALALGLADLLDDHLLCRLRRDPAEIDGRKLIRQEVADFGIRLLPARRLDDDLRGLILDGLDDLAVAGQRDVAGPMIDVGPDVVLLPILRPRGLLDRLLHGLQHFVPLDVFLAGNRVGNLQQLTQGTTPFTIPQRQRRLTVKAIRPPVSDRAQRPDRRLTPAWPSGSAETATRIRRLRPRSAHPRRRRRANAP